MLVILVGVLPAAAQGIDRAWLSPLESQKFPEISAYLDLHNEDGSFAHGLKAGEVSILENGKELPLSRLEEVRPGVQFVVAITFGPALGIRDGIGVSRYEYLVQGLSSWKRDSQASNPDDLSLLVDGGPEAVHLEDPGEWIATLQSFQPNPRRSSPSMQILSRALDVASDPLPRPGMERFVLFITPPQTADVAIGLQNLAARATQQRIRISVWLVAPAEYATSSEAGMLQDLAARTGGGFFLFTGSEAIPDPEQLLDPLRSIYSLSYTSAITTSGTYTVTAQIAHEDLQVSTPPQSLQVNLLPPNPMFVSLPAQIQRLSPAGEARKGQFDRPDELTLQPRQQAITVLIEFPDGNPRPISKSVLYVDGEAAEENSTPPFEKFDWDLSSYTESGLHLLRVEAIDSLGLQGSSIEIPVQVNVKLPRTGLGITISKRGALLAGLTILLAGSILGLVLILAGRVKPVAFGKADPSGRSRRGLPRPATPRAESTLQSPALAVGTSPRRMPNWISRLQRMSHRPQAQILAYLLPTPDSEEAIPPSPLPITADEVIFGRDPQLAGWTIDDPALEPVHARLLREGDCFRLIDEGSIAGTWVNFELVSGKGTVLEHGDLVHLGRTGFRFTLRNPRRTRKPLITPQEARS